MFLLSLLTLNRSDQFSLHLYKMFIARSASLTLLVVIKSQNSLSWQIVSLIEIIKTENSSFAASGLRLDATSAPVAFRNNDYIYDRPSSQECAPTICYLLDRERSVRENFEIYL